MAVLFCVPIFGYGINLLCKNLKCTMIRQVLHKM